MISHLKMKNVGPAPEMELEFAPRLNIITGDNGLGKSFLLDVTWWALTRRWPRDVNHNLSSGYAARPTGLKKTASIEFSLVAKSKKQLTYSSAYVPRDEAWTGKAGRPWNPGLVIYAHADGGFSVWDPARNYWKKRGNVDVQERLPAYVFSSKDVWEGLEVDVDGKPTVVCNGLVRDWASWVREDGVDARRMAALLNKLSVSSDPVDNIAPGPLTRLSVNDARDVPSIKTAYDIIVPIVHASAGVRRIVALAYMLLWSWKEHNLAAVQTGQKTTRQVVMLVDELESHLHPRWQRSILGALLDLVKVIHNQATIQLITATHSPLVLASTEPYFDANLDAWFDLDLVRKGKKAEAMLLQRDFVRHGDVCNWLTSEAFDLKSARSREAEEVLERASFALADEKFDKKQAKKLHEELKKVLGDTDPFWTRWRYVGEKKGWLP